MRFAVPLAVVLLSALAAWLLVAAPREGGSDGSVSRSEDLRVVWPHRDDGVSGSGLLGRREHSSGQVGVPERPRVPTTTTPPLTGLPDTATAVTGTASWFCHPPRYPRCTRGVPAASYAAAAGPALRVGDWRGRIVKVCAGSRCVRVRLSDWCACPRRVIDLYWEPFSQIADPSRGLTRVSVTWGGSAGTGLPPTSTED
jgi:hypothetical protein